MKRKPYFIAPLFSFLLGLSLFAAGTLPLSELSADRYMQHVSFLASDDLKGRGNGSPELERAAEYIAAQFRSYGLQTAGDNGTYFQKFDITTGAEFGSKNTLQVSGVSKEKGKDFVTMPVSSSGSYEGPVVFAGYGMTSESLKWDDYAGIDVKGKAVLVFRHDPEETNPAGRFAQRSHGSVHLHQQRFAMPAHMAPKRSCSSPIPNNHPDEADTVGKATSDLEFRDLSILAMHVTRDSVMSLFTRSGRNMAEVQQSYRSGSKAAIIRVHELENSSVGGYQDRFAKRFAMFLPRYEARTLSSETSGLSSADTTITLASVIPTIPCLRRTWARSITAQTTMPREQQVSSNSPD